MRCKCNIFDLFFSFIQILLSPQPNKFTENQSQKINLQFFLVHRKLKPQLFEF